MRKGIVIVGHGSPLPHYAKVMEKHKERITNFGIFDEIEIAYATGDREPTPLDAVKKMSSEVVYLVPLFLSNGLHVTKDLPAFFGLEEGEGTKITEMDGKKVIICDSIGEDLFVTYAILNSVFRVSERQHHL